MGLVVDLHKKGDVNPVWVGGRPPRLRKLYGLTATRGDGPNTQARRDERRSTEEKPFDTRTPTSNHWHTLPSKPVRCCWQPDDRRPRMGHHLTSIPPPNCARPNLTRTTNKEAS